jgi:hypothetical protein
MLLRCMLLRCMLLYCMLLRCSGVATISVVIFAFL